MKKPILKLTEDGSHTFYVPEIDECYHSTHGAIQESMHIFINSAFNHCNRQDINVLEIGFGTGLNAFLTLMEAGKRQVTVHYTALELYPVPVENALQLNYPEIIGGNYRPDFETLHTSLWNVPVKISNLFTLTKRQVDFTKISLQDRFDVIYFDAFSPEKQPEMWTEKLFTEVFKNANENAVLTTYCSKGVVRRAMNASGFLTQKIPGPPGKREILRAGKACKDSY